MKEQNVTGFTLVELVVVILLLAVLAVVATPKLLDLKTDARNASLNEVRGQIEGQIALIHGKMILAGLSGRNAARTDPVTGGGYYGDEPASNPFHDICGHDCYFIYGTPSASATTLSSIMPAIGQQQDIVFAGYHNNDWVAQGVTGTNIVGTFSFRDNVNIVQSRPGQNSLKQNNCYIWYSGARQDRSYKIGVVPCV